MISQDLISFEADLQMNENEISMDWLYRDYNTDKNFNRFPDVQDGKELTLFFITPFVDSKLRGI